MSCLSSFHGRTLFTVSVGGQPKYTEGFEPLPQEINHIPYNDIEAARAAITDDVCAVIVEPIQGEGGVIPGDKAYLQGAARAVRQDRRAADLRRSAVGRGPHRRAVRLHGQGRDPGHPDLGQGAGQRLPDRRHADHQRDRPHFNVGSHGTTYGGNPLAATVALNVIETINQPAFLARVKEASAKLRQPGKADPPTSRSCSARCAAGPADRPADGRRLQGPRQGLTKIRRSLGLMLLIAGPDVVRLAPALIVSDAQIAEADRIMRAAADGMLAA
jgi:succinylornithine aminotransferase